MTYRARIMRPIDLGLALQQGRMAQDLTQRGLARKSGISQSAISELESGKGTLYIERLLYLLAETGVELYAEWEKPEKETKNLELVDGRSK